MRQACGEQIQPPNTLLEGRMHGALSTCNFHEAHRQSGLSREFAGADERALNAKSLTPSRRLFERLRQAPTRQRADSGETVPVASPARWRHQRLDLERAHPTRARQLPLQPQGHSPGASQGGDQGQARQHQARARPGEVCDQACTALDRSTNALLPRYLPQFPDRCFDQMAGHRPARRLSISSTLATSPQGQTSCTASTISAKAGNLFRLACKKTKL